MELDEGTPTSIENEEVINAEPEELLEETPSEPEEAPAFEPSLTYTVQGKEHEIPEAFKDFITDEEKQNMIKELYEKATGLDFMKESRENYKNQLTEIQGRMGGYQEKAQKLEDAQYFIEKGDIASAVKTLGLTNDHIVSHAVAVLEAAESGKSIEGNNDAIQARELERQLAARDNELKAHQHRLVVDEFNHATGAHESLIQTFEEKYGKGAFRAEVSRHGEHQAKKNPNYTITQAVNDVISQISWMAPPQAPQEETQTPNQQTTSFPTLTTKTSSAASPVKKKISTMAELEKLSKEAGE